MIENQKRKCKDGKGHDFKYTKALFGKRQCVKCSLYEYIYEMIIKNDKNRKS